MVLLLLKSNPLFSEVYGCFTELTLVLPRGEGGIQGGGKKEITLVQISALVSCMWKFP